MSSNLFPHLLRTLAAPRRDLRLGHRVLLLLAAIVVCWTTVATACPFCSTLPHTLSDDLEESAAAVVARCESSFVEPDGASTYRMRITTVVNGDPALKNTVIEVASTQTLSEGSLCWLVGFGEEDIQWVPPTAISPEGVFYLVGLKGLPEDGPKRLEYFLEFLKHGDEIVASDAYNEFAEASLEDISRLSDRLDRRWLISQLRDRSVPTHRRRLCWTLLSRCGTAADASLFDESIRNRQDDPSFDPGMDAAIACFIVLGGERALSRIERDYLAKPDAEYSDSFAAICALRVHGTELNVIPRARLASALRAVLDRPSLADSVIPDLARWGDWSAIDRVAELFENSTEDSSLLKLAAVRYLKTCPLPEGRKALERLRDVDPDAVHLAESSMMFYSGRASVPVPPPEDQTPSVEAPEVQVAETLEDNRKTIREASGRK